jgi:hypothetical protein
MTTSELAARTALSEAVVREAALGRLRSQGLVSTHELRVPDPHLPPVTAVALVEDGPDGRPAAEQRARACAESVQRRLLGSHRCL